MRFGISTHVFHNEQVGRSHFDLLAAHGFELVEVFATRAHIDYHDNRRMLDVRQAIEGAGLGAWSVHAPIADTFVNGAWGRAYSIASPDPAVRQEAVDETSAAIRAAGLLGCAVVVVHVGIPREQRVPPGDNDAGCAARSLESLARACESAGVQLALELIPNQLSTAETLVDWLEGTLDLGSTGACLDIGHAHLTGGAPEAAELLSGYITTTHVHDNRGRRDDHLVPFDGVVDWPATLMTLSKVGYSGPLVFEIPDHGNAEATLARAVAARARIRAILDDLERPFTFEEA
jgi:sugar phosphate isomerase/epimerase